MIDLKTLIKNKKAFQSKKEFHTKKTEKKYLAFAVILLSIIFGFFLIKFQKTEIRYQKTKKALQQLQYEVKNIKPYQEALLAPKLAKVPYMDAKGVVLSAKTLQIPGVDAPYNPALITIQNRPYLFFRYDVLSNKATSAPFFSRIGGIFLDENLEPDEKSFHPIPLQSDYVEDPRAIVLKNKIYLFTTLFDPKMPRCRTMHLAIINSSTMEVEKELPLDLNLQWVEKNWTPFEYQDEQGHAHLYFEYQMSPRKLFAIADLDQGKIENITLPKEITYMHMPWESKWGRIRGGTPPQKIGDEYLSFFHSSFKEENGIHWYVMGAYTFQAKPPFAITRMSSQPILFQKMFDTPIIHTADLYKRVIFPSGFIREIQEGKKRIHLACGSNDCAIQMVTFDEEKLIESMTPFQ